MLGLLSSLIPKKPPVRWGQVWGLRDSDRRKGQRQRVELGRTLLGMQEADWGATLQLQRVRAEDMQE